MVGELRQLDTKHRVFGAERHKYAFQSPLTEEEVSDFEQQRRVALPAEYRTYLTRVANGGVGPCYGLKPLQDAARFSSLEVPFPWSREQTLESRHDQELWRTSPGSLMLADRGCAGYDFLVVNGVTRGQVWSDCPEADVCLVPTGLSFLDWYSQWLSRCIKTIGREPLLRRVRKGMSLAEVREILGRENVRDDSRSTLDEKYWLSFPDTNALVQFSSAGRVLEIRHFPIV